VLQRRQRVIEGTESHGGGGEWEGRGHQRRHRTVAWIKCCRGCRGALEVMLGCRQYRGSYRGQRAVEGTVL
jgi:hypothetical protein